MASAISGYIDQIANAVYGEQVRTAIINALEACYSDVENPDLQSDAFLEAINEAYASGILDITEVTQVSQMTNDNIIYRYMGSETGYFPNTLYYYNGEKWEPLGSGASIATNLPIRGWINGYVASNAGAITNGGTKIVTVNKIPVNVGDTVLYTGDGTSYKFDVRLWKDDGTFVGNSGWKTSEYEIPQNGYVLIQLTTSADTAFDSDLFDESNKIFLKSGTLSRYESEAAFSHSQENKIANSRLSAGYVSSSGTITLNNIVAYGNEKTTDFIEVEPGGEYILKIYYDEFDPSVVAPWYGWACYDENKAFVSGSRNSTTLTEPLRDAYGRQYIQVLVRLNTTSTIMFMRISFRSINGAYAELTQNPPGEAVVVSTLDAENLNKIQTNPSPITTVFPYKSVSHRGYRDNGIPENTIPAFKRAAQEGFKIVECDIYETSDEYFILSHSNSLNINGTSKQIKDCTYAETQTVNLGEGDYAGTKIPTLDEFLLLCKRLQLYPYVDIKTFLSVSETAKIVNIAKSLGVDKMVSWISSSTDYLAAVVDADPMARVGVYNKTAHDAASLRNGRNEVFFEQNYTTLTTDIVTLCKELNITLEVFTPNTESDILALDPYVSGVTSDTLNAGEVIKNHYIEL